MPVLSNIRRMGGLAGQFGYALTVTYPGEAPRPVQFVGNKYGHHVVMVTESNPEGLYVIGPERYGPTLTPEWVRAFYA